MLYTELRVILAKTGIRQVDLARLVGCDKQSVYRWVSGRRPIPKYVETLTSILYEYPDIDTTPPSLNPEEILGISSKAKPQEAKQAWRALLRKTHPDVGGSLEETQKINAAYEDFLNQNIKKGE